MFFSLPLTTIAPFSATACQGVFGDMTELPAGSYRDQKKRIPKMVEYG